MGKDGFLSPKAIGNRIKAKGLQKLRWYCQMCEKQCRDQNGFKCHCESESHQRNMILFSQNSGKMLNQFSHEFEQAFLDIVKRRAKTTMILANQVYNELISDRHHTHMNATIWVTMTNFVKHLGKSGKCKVEERPKGWYIQYIERDPDMVMKQDALLKSKKHELDEEARNIEYIKEQVAKAAAEAAEAAKAEGEAGVVDPEALKTMDFAFSLKPMAKKAAGNVFGGGVKKEERASAVVEAVADGDEEDADAENGEGEDEEGTGMYVDHLGRVHGIAEEALSDEDGGTAAGEAEEKEKGEEKKEQKDQEKKETKEQKKEQEKKEPVKEKKAEEKDARPPGQQRKEADLPKKEADAPKKEERPSVPAASSTKSDSTKSEKETAIPKKEREEPRGRPAEAVKSEGGGSKWSSAPPAPSAQPAQAPKRKLTAVEEIMLQEERKKEKMNRKDYWLDTGIVVKVMNKKLADGKYYKRKGVVEEVLDRYVAMVTMLDPEVKGHKLKLDQSQLETVIPAIGGRVRIVNGAYRGVTATLLGVDVDKFCAQVKIDHGLHSGRVIERIDYEDICKLDV